MSTSTKAGPSSRTGQPILTARGVTKSFPGVRALKGVDLTVWPGEVHALVGENGAGKSTLMKILAGAQRPDGGEISLDGKPVHFHTPHQARAAGIGIIYQELTIAPNLTVAGNVIVIELVCLKSCVGQCPPPVIAIALTGTSPHPSRLLGSVAGLH